MCDGAFFTITPNTAMPLQVANLLRSNSVGPTTRALAAALAFPLLIAATSVGQTYSLIDLGELTSAVDLNDHTQILGSRAGRPVVWENGAITELAGLDGEIPRASSINNGGQIVGSSYNLLIQQRAVIWDSSTSPAEDLGDIVNNDSVSLSGRDINDVGQIVGEADSNSAARAFLWQDGSMSELTGQGTANAINNNGAIAGIMSGVVATHAFLIDNEGVMIDLGDLTDGTGVSYATDINDSAQVVGGSLTTSGTTHAFLTAGGSMVDLGDLTGGTNESRAHGINNAGTVVGRSGGEGGNRAFVWTSDAGMVDLNGLLNDSANGWILQTANSINSGGQIVGSGINPDGEQRGFLLRQGLACDFDADSQCSATDLDLLYARFGETGGLFNLNGDAMINAGDTNAWLSLASDPSNPHTEGYRIFRQGDVNLDGYVDSSDLGILLNNFGDMSRLGFADGNLNGDDNVDSTDLGLVLNDFGFASQPSVNAVPEPAVNAWIITLLALLQARQLTRRR